MYNAREAAKCSITSLGVLNTDTVKAKATVLALDRLQRLVAKLDEARFILRIDLPKFFLVSAPMNCRGGNPPIIT